MTHPSHGGSVQPSGSGSTGTLDKVLRVFSMITMAMTVPQVYAVWFGREVGGVSLASWTTYLVSAVLWFVYGWRRRDRTIYVACIGWIVLDAAIVAGVMFRSH